VFMSKKRWDALPAAARKVIEDNSGEPVSRAFGRFWEGEVSRGKEIAATKGVGDKRTVVKLSPQQEKVWRDKVQADADEWARNYPNGVKTLVAFRDILAKVKAGN